MGRPKSTGKRFYLGRVRFEPGRDPPELLDVLEAIEAAGSRKATVLKAALIGGAASAEAEAGKDESALETERLLAELF